MEERRPWVNRETTSLPDELDGFYGRDGDKEAIRRLVLSDDPNTCNPGVIPIVGMGGIGKTTLAQHVFNDKKVAKRFNIRGWICVSVEFTVLRLTKLILEEVTGRASDSNNLNQLQHNLMAALNGKKFLLVLDDVWSEDYDGWTKLLTPLRYGKRRSKIIITTRSKKVASKVQTVPTYDLSVLEYEDCWKLFARHACIDVNSAANHPELEEIGEKIVRKCGGLPLAAKALGGVLRWETKAEKWKEVLKSEIWDVQNANILPALALSYIHIPSHLKRCFAYCAIFPQDYKFQKGKLVALWTAEGFLVQRKSNRSLEQIGDMYFEDLVSRSFFQQENGYFVLHDLMHDLARFVSGEFCSRLESGTSREIREKTRHLSYGTTAETIMKKLQGIHETPFLRTFVPAEKLEIYCNIFPPTICFNKEDIGTLLLTRNLLRIMSLSRFKIRELPNSIGNLKHMRHLDLSGTSIRLLPETVTTLFNLEILILRQCRGLIELPADTARLINLCQIDLQGTYLRRMPPEMGKLKKLSKLTYFVVGENRGSNINELGCLHYLGGHISIRKLQNADEDGDASEAILKDKENLKRLQLEWEGPADNSRQVKQAKQVLERLQPHIHIECIEILGYGGIAFTNWVGDISFSKLKKLHLFGCKNCICLPPLGQLASLEELSIDCTWEDAVLDGIGLEFYGMCKPGEKPFSSLKTLKFQSMKNWREWISCNGAFPILEELELLDCCQLTSVCHNLPSLQRLRIGNCRAVKCISLEAFPNLKKLEICDCFDLESLVGSTTTTTTTRRTSDPLFFPSLTSLHINRCSKLVSFPRGGLHAPNLKRMIIEGCGNLKSLPQGMHFFLPSLGYLKIHLCQEIESLPEEGWPFSLSCLYIFGCPSLKERCERETGEDWPKIEHIPCLLVA